MRAYGRFEPGPVPLGGPEGTDEFLARHVESVRVCEDGAGAAALAGGSAAELMFYQVVLDVLMYQLSEEEPAEELEGEEEIAT